MTVICIGAAFGGKRHPETEGLAGNRHTLCEKCLQFPCRRPNPMSLPLA
jgi:hypothetical protein